MRLILGCYFFLQKCKIEFYRPSIQQKVDKKKDKNYRNMNTRYHPSTGLFGNPHSDSLEEHLQRCHYQYCHLEHLQILCIGKCCIDLVSEKNDSWDENDNCYDQDRRVLIEKLSEHLQHFIITNQLFPTEHIRSKRIIEPVRVSEAALDDGQNVGVLYSSSNPLLVVYLLIYIQFFHMCRWSDFHSHFHSLRQTVTQLYFYHKSDNLSHRTVRNGRRIININLFVRLHHTPFKTYHTQLLQSQRVFRVIDISDKFVDLVLVKGVIDVIVEFYLFSLFLLVEAELVSLV